MLKKQLNKKVIERKEIPATDKEDNYIVLDKVAGNHKKADVYSIIKYASKNSKDIDKIKSTISDINNALDTYKSIMEKRIQIFKKDNPSLNDDEAFVCAHKEKYDNAKEIRRKAYGVIVEILRMERPNYIFVDVDYAALVYDQLMLYMKKRITDFYIEKNKNGKCILTFDEIVEQIVVDYHEKIDTVAYQYFQVLRSIYDAYAEYPSETWNNCTVSNCIDCQDSSVCNLYKQISILHNKSEDDINQIIHNLMLKTPQVGKSNNLPQDSLVSHLFLNLLDEIKTLGLEKSNVYEAIKDGIKKYRLTLDSSYSTNEFQQNLQTALKKEADRSVLYECDVLITDRLREEALFYNGSDVHVLTEKELNEINSITSSTVEKIKKDCIRPKIIRLIDKNIALGELK